MTVPRVVPFADEHLAGAGELLAARHAAHRHSSPLLDPRYADPTQARAAVEDAWQTEGAAGAVAVDGDAVVGYLIGAPKADAVWGPNVWVGSAGLAVVDAEVARDLYAQVAAGWVAEGRTAHYVVVPAHDLDLLDAWYRLGFGQQHAHAVRPVPEHSRPTVPGITVRRAERSDIPALARLDLTLPEHQALAPVFSSGGVPTAEEALAEWEESFDDARFATFVAELDGIVVGSSIGCALELSSAHSALMRPSRAGFLGFAAVLPEARGRGAGRALGEAVLGWTREAGFTSAATDWRVTNLLSSGAWPRLGFRTTFLRLHRLVGH